MKKVFLLVVALLIALTCCVTSVAYAETTAANYKESEAYKLVEELCAEYPNRQAGITVNNPFYTDDSGKSLQQYLKDKLVDMSDGAIKADDVDYSPFGISDSKKGYNIVARLNKSGSDKQIIIGAHYDSDGQGANDNASGVAALMLVVKGLSKSDLPCNVVFVLFDGEENGMLGSYSYVNEMFQADKDNTLLMVNIDSVANGDNLYVWCENKHTDLANLFVSKSDKLTEKPYANGTYYLGDVSSTGHGYIETPQGSDHTPFRQAGIPTALFFSGTYSADPWNYAESTNLVKNTMNTSSDTFEKLDNNNGAEFVAKIETTANVIVETVRDGSFIQTAANQRKQLVNLNVLGRSLWARIICFGILVIAVVLLACVYYRKLQKRAIMGTAEIKNTKVFTTPDAKDIFSFADTKTDSKPSVDDIFTFDDKNKK